MRPIGSSSFDARPPAPIPAEGNARQDMAAVVSVAWWRGLTRADLGELVGNALNASASRANGGARPELSVPGPLDAEHDLAGAVASRINNQGLETRTEALATECGSPQPDTFCA